MVYFDVVNPEISEFVQKFLIKNGYRWISSGQTVTQLEKRYIAIYADKTLCICTQDTEQSHQQQGRKRIPLEDLFGLRFEINSFQIGNYTAEVRAESVIANNMTFSYDLVKEIINRMKNG